MPNATSIPIPMNAGGFRKPALRYRLAAAASSTRHIRPILKRAARLGAFVALAVMLSGCFSGDNTMSLDVVGYNHTDHDIGYFSVNGVGGAYEGKHEGGGAVCCILVPKRYKPGMTVTVRWGGLEIGATQQRIIEVPLYKPEDGGEFHVHFLKDGNVKAFVTRYMEWHPNYPLKGDEAKL